MQTSGLLARAARSISLLVLLQITGEMANFASAQTGEPYVQLFRRKTDIVVYIASEIVVGSLIFYYHNVSQHLCVEKRDREKIML